MLQKITIFGDSISKGVFLDENKPQNLKTNAVSILQEQFGFDIENNSKFGQTLQKVFERGIIEKYVKTNHENEIVVLALGGNDADYDWAQVQKNPNFCHQSKTNLKDFEDMLAQSIKLLKQTGAKVVVASLCPIDSNLFFENVLSKNFDGQKILEFLQNDVQNIYRHQELFNLSALKIAFANDCTFFDYRTEMLKLRNLKSLMCCDGIHPNEEGQKFVAKLAVKKLEHSNTNFLEILKKKTANQNYVSQVQIRPIHFALKQFAIK